MVKTDPSLTARLAAFMEEYVRCLDDDQLEQWPSFFTDDCKYKVTTRENLEANYPFGLIYADSNAMLQDRVKSLRTVNIYEEHRYRHFLGLPHVIAADATGVVDAQTSFLVVRIMLDGGTTVFATGRYQDKLQVAEARISIRERTVVCDSSRVDTLLAFPL